MARRSLNVGMIGYNFMGKAHSNAWRQAPKFFDLPADITLHTICGRSPGNVESAREQLGWRSASTDWKAVVSDPEIDIVDICTPNDSHCEIALEAARNGKAILCEKPLAMDVSECVEMVAAVKKAKVVNMVCHNYRRIPAIALAKKMIERGDLGDRIYHVRARYAQDRIADPSSLWFGGCRRSFPVPERMATLTRISSIWAAISWERSARSAASWRRSSRSGLFSRKLAKGSEQRRERNSGQLR